MGAIPVQFALKEAKKLAKVRELISFPDTCLLNYRRTEKQRNDLTASMTLSKTSNC